VPYRIRFGDDVLSFTSTTMTFGTPMDITLSELALETFFPADNKTAAFLRDLAKSTGLVTCLAGHAAYLPGATKKKAGP
jgi:hypothetical protein